MARPVAYIQRSVTERDRRHGIWVGYNANQLCVWYGDDPGAIAVQMTQDGYAPYRLGV